MNERLQQNLAFARAVLLREQDYLAHVRRTPELRCWTRTAETEVCRAIDRAWDAQCMAQGSLR